MALTLLIVDDHPGFRGFARELLEAEGLDVVGEAADGASALAETERLDPDVVLLDVVLPGIDGFEVCDRLADATPPAGGGADLEPGRRVVRRPDRAVARARFRREALAHRGGRRALVEPEGRP